MRRTPFFALSLLTIGGLVAACGEDDSHETTGGHGENDPVADGAREIVVTAADLSYDPLEVHVAVGEEVAIKLQAEDVLHDVTIDELDFHVSAKAGKSAEGGFVATEPGEYPFYCSVEGHRESGMEGTLIVS